MYYVHEEDFERIPTIPVSNGMPGYGGFNQIFQWIHDIGKRRTLHMKIKKHGLASSISEKNLKKQSSIIATTRGFTSCGISSLLPLKPMKQYGYAC
ncbi:hypothetical protein V6N13_041570 [Hibiscus sabdariffa]